MIRSMRYSNDLTAGAKNDQAVAFHHSSLDVNVHFHFHKHSCNICCLYHLLFFKLLKVFSYKVFPFVSNAIWCYLVIVISIICLQIRAATVCLNHCTVLFLGWNNAFDSLVNLIIYWGGGCSSSILLENRLSLTHISFRTPTLLKANSCIIFCDFHFLYM